MRLTSWNINGLRSAHSKKLKKHLRDLAPDVVLFQEIRCNPDQVPKGVPPRGWHVHWHPAERKGYSGLATWARQPLEVLGTGMDGPDPEGRVLQTRVAGLRLVNVYLPSGARGDRQPIKDAYLERFLPWASRLAALDEPVLMAGDFNIAHTERDIHDPKGNAKGSGFLPHERLWFSALLERGWTDVGRACWGEVQGPYTWWSNQGRARAEDRGWRIDYWLANPAAAARVRSVSVLRQGGLDTSDHAPVTIDIE